MAKLLYIESSPRKDRSSSIEVSNFFLNEYKKKHPNDSIITVDLWKKEIPPFDGDVIDSKYAIMHQQTFTAAQKKAWQAVEDVINEFKSADKYVISLPMWNFSIPYTLKHYFDVIVQPGYTFSFSPETGYKGLVTGKKAIIIYSRGGTYGAETGMQNLDYQKHYMETIMPFIGFKDIKSIVIEPTQDAPAKKVAAMTKAKDEALQALAQF